METNNDSLNKILKRVAKEEQYEKCEMSIQAIFSGGTNYSSYLYSAVLSAPGKNDLKLFVKIAALGEKIRNSIPHNVFKTESFFYNKLCKIYENIEEKHMVSAEHRLVIPKFYGCIDEYCEEALALEDMTSKGYQSFNRLSTIDWNYAYKSVKNLAIFHALSIAWSVEDPKGFEKVKELKCNIGMAKMLDIMKSIIFNSVEFVKHDYKERVVRFLKEATKGNRFMNYYNPIRRPVVAHSDYRPNNLLHKIHDNGDVDVISVDYQLLKISNPMIDLLFFIYIGSDKTFRKQYMKQTLEQYYTEMCAALRRLNLNPDHMYPREDFNYELEQMQPFGLILSMFWLPVTTAKDDDALEVNEDNDLESFATKPSELSRERINDIIEDYIDMGLIL